MENNWDASKAKRGQMEIKETHFIPNIEDIRVGYEFEYNGHYTHTKSDWGKQVVKPEWYFMNYKSGWDTDPTITFYMGDLKKEPQNFRVAYLTKEQIEAELVPKGWKQDLKVYSGESWDKRNEHGFLLARMDFDFKEKTLTIYKQDYRDYLPVIYEGECKDINTFRMICKLLGI